MLLIHVFKWFSLFTFTGVFLPSLVTARESRSNRQRHTGVLRRSRSLLASISSSFPSNNSNDRGGEKADDVSKEKQAGVESSSLDSSETSNGGSNDLKRKEEKDAVEGNSNPKEAAPAPEILGFSRMGQSAVDDGANIHASYPWEGHALRKKGIKQSHHHH